MSAVMADGLLRTAARQAVALMLLAALPAVGMWIWQGHGRGDAPRTEGGRAVTAQAEGENAGDMVDLAAAMAWGESVLWVDARQKAEFERAHIPGALLLNEDDWSGLLPVFLQRWNPDRRVVVYCDGGACQASREVGARLRDAGISPVYVLRGGWPAWEKLDRKSEAAGESKSEAAGGNSAP